MSYRFLGTERWTFELDGTLDASVLRLPAALQPALDTSGRARVRLFGFDVENMRMDGVPVVRASYAELLWWIDVRDGDAAAWWVLACDLGPAIPRLAAARLVRYPVRPNTVELARDRMRVTSRIGLLDIAIGAAIGATTTPGEMRTVLVGDEAQWRVPWGDNGRADAVGVTVRENTLATSTLGATVTWSATGWLRAGREHRCGIAERVRG